MLAWINLDNRHRPTLHAFFPRSRHSRSENSTARSRETDLSQCRVGLAFWRDLGVHEERVRREHDAVDLGSAELIGIRSAQWHAKDGRRHWAWLQNLQPELAQVRSKQDRSTCPPVPR